MGNVQSSVFGARPIARHQKSGYLNLCCFDFQLYGSAILNCWRVPLINLMSTTYSKGCFNNKTCASVAFFVVILSKQVNLYPNTKQWITKDLRLRSHRLRGRPELGLTMTKSFCKNHKWMSQNFLQQNASKTETLIKGQILKQQTVLVLCLIQ